MRLSARDDKSDLTTAKRAEVACATIPLRTLSHTVTFARRQAIRSFRSQDLDVRRARAAIGVFDSGIGGLTVVRALRSLT
jgi:hypothetical protein